MLFWDLRACKFLESTMNSNRAVTLKVKPAPNWMIMSYIICIYILPVKVSPSFLVEVSLIQNFMISTSFSRRQEAGCKETTPSWTPSKIKSTPNMKLKCRHLPSTLTDETVLWHICRYFPAIYTHCYDTSGTRLFAAGGPLQCGLKVCSYHRSICLKLNTFWFPSFPLP